MRNFTSIALLTALCTLPAHAQVAEELDKRERCAV
ncbi:MAG: hypothetical protein H6Q89_1243, partial [Myxococcaceae bacterium]|nr:hypothetical protein [Myxococcaceae bacterium]